MKRLLLSCALIGATFGCNAMDSGAASRSPEGKYKLIKELKKSNQLTVKLVNENLVGNEYVMGNLGEFLQFALKAQSFIPASKIDNFIFNLSIIPLWFKDPISYRNANDLLGRIRIIQIAHDICKDVQDHDKLNIEALTQPKARVEEFLALADKALAKEENNKNFLSSVPSAVSLRNGAIGLAVLAGIVGISYWNSSKKAPQDN